MLDLLSLISALNRPSLLVRTARFGIDDYSRTQHLGRILKTVHLPRTGEAILQLLEIENDLNTARTANRAEYAIAEHVEVLIALMGEARLLRAATRPLPAPT
jgi:hypothetical protein